MTSSKTVDSLAKSWKYTPFMEGNCKRRIGVDCDNYVFSILSDLLDVPFERSIIKKNSMITNSDHNFRIIRKLARKYRLYRIQGPVKHGDIIITGQNNSLMHVGIVGNSGREVHHCDSRGVTKSTLASFFSIYSHTFGIFRSKWLQPHSN